MAKPKHYSVQLRLDLVVDVDIYAESLEDAIKKGKEINAGKDILQEDVSWIDGDATVTGVFENESR